MENTSVAMVRDYNGDGLLKLIYRAPGWFHIKYFLFFCLLYENTLIKYIENFTTKKKKENFQIKNSDILHISAQNIDCGYFRN